MQSDQEFDSQQNAEKSEMALKAIEQACHLFVITGLTPQLPAQVRRNAYISAYVRSQHDASFLCGSQNMPNNLRTSNMTPLHRINSRAIIQPIDIGDFGASFLLVMLSGLPRFCSSSFAYFAFARFCAGVCAMRKPSD